MNSRREKLLQKLNPDLLKMTPKLSGVSGSVIDLKSDEKSLDDGAKKLMMRFIKNQDLSEKYKRDQSQNDTEVIVSSLKYNDDKEICELISERLIFSFNKNDIELDSEKPGRKLQKLKMELQDKMSAKWEEEYKKRVSESKAFKESSNKHKKKGFEERGCQSDEESENNEKFQHCEDVGEAQKEFDENESDGDVPDGEDEEDEETQKEFDEDENDGDSTDDEGENDEDAASVNNGDDQVDESVSPAENPGNDNAEDGFDGDGCSLVPPYQPGGGLLYGGSELTQSEEDLPQNLLSPSLKFSMSRSPVFKSFEDSNTKSKELTVQEATDNLHLDMYMEKTNIFQNSQNANDLFDLNDAFEFCSGKFPDAEERFKSQLETQRSVPYTKENSIEKTQNVEYTKEREEEEEEEEEETNLEDKGLGSEQDLPKTRKNIITLEDSETEDNCNKLEEVEESDPSAGKILLDDEDETAAGEQPALLKKKSIKTLHFSDEEDETNDCKDKNNISELEEDENNGEDFDQRSINYDSEENEILNPKEFFEGEAEISGSEWSGDEDEQGLDVLDQEDGDADELDNDQVRSQLEKIHIRRVLDDDAREVRLIQEILFEDGDLHSDGKRRDRKFKWKNLGTFEEKGNKGEIKENLTHSSDEDCAEEEELRKMRHQKELFFMGMKKNPDLSSDDEVVEENFQMLKVTSFKNSLKLSETDEKKILNGCSIAHNNEYKKALSLCNARGSFLTRNEEFLSKLAKATSGVTENVMGPKNSKNFVFVTKSPEKVNTEKNPSCKRQIEESESCGRREKKIKLLPRAFDTAPSILDLLY